MADSKTVYDFSSVLNVETDDDSTIEPLEIEQQLAKEERVYDFSSVLKAEEVDLDEISTARQLGYGFEQEPQLLGTAYRGVKAVGRSLFSDDTVAESFRNIEGERQEEILEDYPEFRGLKEEDESGYVIAGRVGSGVTDVAGWAFPWARVAKYGTGAVVATGAAFSAGETAARDYALYGEVDTTNVLIAATIGGTVSGVAEQAQRLVAKKIKARKEKGQPTEVMEKVIKDSTDPEKILPTVILDSIPPSAAPLPPMREVIKNWKNQLNEKQRMDAGEIILTDKSSQKDFVNASNRFQNGLPQSMTVKLTKKETEALQESTEKVSKVLDASPADSLNVSSIAEQTNIVEKATIRLLELDKARVKAVNAKDTAMVSNINKEIKAQQKIKTETNDRLVSNAVKYSEQRVSSSIDILEDMADKGTLTSNIMQSVLQNVATPIGYGIGGGAIGLTTIGEDDGWGYVGSYALAGASLGLATKRIQNSTAFTDIDKATGDIVIKNAGASWLKQASTHMRYLTGMSTATRMDAQGGWQKVIANTLFSKLGSNVEGVEGRTQRVQSEYLAKLFKITGAPAERSWLTRLGRVAVVDYDKVDELNISMNTVAGEVMRGFVTLDKLVPGYRGLKNDLAPLGAEDITEIKLMVPKLESLRDSIANRMEEVGVKFNRIENYGIQQLWDQRGVDLNYPKFVSDMQEALYIQKKNQALAKGDDPSGITKDSLREEAQETADKLSGRYIDPENTRYVGSQTPSIFSYNKAKKLYTYRTAAKAFEKQRKLTDVEANKFMYEQGYLSLHAGDALSGYGTKSIKVAEFSEAFGAGGEIINLALQKTREAFDAAIQKNPANREFLKKRMEEYEEQMVGSIEAYWGGYGQPRSSTSDIGIKAFTTLANVTYLTTVSIANLGDLVQPFTNSSYAAAARTVSQRVFGKSDEQFSAMSSFKYDKSYERDLSSFMRKNDTGSFSRRLDNLNDFFFFTAGLSKVTKASRNFAYDVGVNRAFTLAKKAKLSKPEMAELSELKLTKNELESIGKYGTVEEAFKEGNALNFLDRAGRNASDRDAIIPSVGNRLLFTQTNDPAMRALGQFMSWALAKTSQSNRLLERVENGDAKLAVKILAATPVYAGFLSLKQLLNPNYVPDEEDNTTAENLQFIGKSLKLNGGFNNAVIDKVAGAITSVSYGKAPPEALVPSLSLLDSMSRGAYYVGVDVVEGEVLTALKKTVKSIPFISQADKTVEKWTGSPLIETEEKEYVRTPYDKGGEVLDVPNASPEPDERIDKMTGLPYNQQAGTAFVDKEDRQDPLQRLGFVKGGMIEDPLKRLGFGI